MSVLAATRRALSGRWDRAPRRAAGYYVYLRLYTSARFVIISNFHNDSIRFPSPRSYPVSYAPLRPRVRTVRPARSAPGHAVSSIASQEIARRSALDTFAPSRGQCSINGPGGAMLAIAVGAAAPEARLLGLRRREPDEALVRTRKARAHGIE